MTETVMHRLARMVLVVSVLAFMLAPLARAEEKAETKADASPFQDKLQIRGGWAYVFGAAANVSVGGPALGVGTSVDFTQTLGGDTSTDALRIDALYHFNERHAIGFSWYRVGLSGEKNLNEQIQIHDNVIPVGASTQTSLSFNTYRLLYNYSFYRSDKAELAFSPGLYMMKTNFDFAAQGTFNGTPGSTVIVKQQLTVPLPSVGLVANYNITQKLKFESRYDFFYLSLGNYSGSMFELYAGLEYRIVRHFALGAAYDRLQAGLRGNGHEGFNASFSYNLLYVYGTIYAF